MKGLIKTIFIGLACALLVAGTIVLEEKSQASANPSESLFGVTAVEVIEKGEDSLFKNENGIYSFDSGAKNRMSVLIGGNAMIRLAPNSSGELNLSKTFPRTGTLKLTRTFLDKYN